MVAVSRFQQRFRPFLVLAIATLFVSVLAAVQPAHAQNASGEVDLVHGAGVVTVVATSTSNDGGDAGDPNGDTDGNTTPGATEWPWTCTFWLSVTLEDVGTTTTSPKAGNYYQLTCSVNDSHIGLVEPINDLFYQYNPDEPIPGQPGFITSIQVREQAQDLALPPTLTPALSPDGRQITGIETWFWPEGSTDPITASATAGGLTVTIEARYVDTTFEVSEPNGARFTCHEFVPWAPGATESPCTHSFFNESPTQEIEAASRWEFYWSDNAGQPVPTLYASVTTTAGEVVEVIDLEAVISRG